MAQSGNPYSCGSRQIRRQQTPCASEGLREKARISDAAFLRKGLITDAMRANKYIGLVELILESERTCDAIVLRNISASYDGGAPVKGKSGGRAKERTVSRLNTVTLADLEMVGNEEFWDDMEAQIDDYDAVWFTGGKMWPVEETLSTTAKNPITDDPEADVEGEATITWSQRTLMKSYNFNRALLAKANAPFIAFDSLTAGGGAATVSGETVTVTESSPVALTVAFTPPAPGVSLEYALATGQNVPAGLVVTPSGSIAAPDGLPAGRYVVRVQATNPCGLLGEVSITFLVA